MRGDEYIATMEHLRDLHTLHDNLVGVRNKLVSDSQRLEDIKSIRVCEKETVLLNRTIATLFACMNHYKIKAQQHE